MINALLYIPRKIWGFLNWLRGTLLNLILLGVIVAVVNTSLQQEAPKVIAGAPLYLAPEGILVDQKSYVPASAMLMDSDYKNSETLVREIITAIDRAAYDSNVPSLILDLNFLAYGDFSKLSEIAAALENFRNQGKTITAYADSFDQGRYFLASYANDIFMDPLGTVDIQGFASYRQFYKDALDKINVSVHVFQAGDFKDFGEPYTRNDMSEESKEHTATWINDLWNFYTANVERNRQLDPGTINEYANQFAENLKTVAGDTAQLALQFQLIDRLATRQDQQAFLDSQGKEFNDFRSYLAATQQNPLLTPNHIAVISARGEIVPGHQPPGLIGADSLSEIIARVRDDKRVKALVIRVDSGGGSSFGSEIIRRELELTRAAGKPVVISMGSVAASGGYWLSLGADEIWAMPTTITGSIGVFSIVPNFAGSFEKLGIHSDGLGTTHVAGGLQLDRPLHPHVKQTLQAGVDHIYQRFLALTASARNRQPEEIHEVAQGRVWSGAQAQGLGLVDHLGYLGDAIRSAAQLAQLKPDNYALTYPKIQLSPAEEFFQKLSEEVSLDLDTTFFGNQASTLRTLEKLPQWQQWKTLADISRKPSDPQASCLVCVVP